MTALETHLAHLIALLAPPHRESWRAYVWDRALTLAKDPEYSALPDMLKAAMGVKSESLC